MKNNRADVHEERFTVGVDSELSVSNVSGAVHVSVADGSEIVVRYERSGSERALQSTEVEVRQEGNRVVVQTKSSHAGLIGFGRSSSVNYDITVPRDCQVRVHAVSADIRVQGPRGGASIQTVSGDVQLSDITGDITVTAVSGDLVATNLSGTLLARTTSGDGRFLSSRFRRFSLNTVSGDFVVETPLLADEHCNAKSVSGDLELLVPPDSGATIQLKSVSGAVTCDLPAEIIKSGRRHWQGRVNGGGGSVEMNSVSGDLKIRKSTVQPDAAIDPQVPRESRPPQVASVLDVSPPRTQSGSGQSDVDGAPSVEVPDPDGLQPAEESVSPRGEDRAAVLRALENGEISVDEALMKLQ